jgi:hypothetical protein
LSTLDDYPSALGEKRLSLGAGRRDSALRVVERPQQDADGDRTAAGATIMRPTVCRLTVRG